MEKRVKIGLAVLVIVVAIVGIIFLSFSTNEPAPPEDFDKYCDNKSNGFECDIKDKPQKKTEIKTYCEEKGGVWSKGPFCVRCHPGEREEGKSLYICDYPYEDAGKECSGSFSDCKGECLGDIEYMKENFNVSSSSYEFGESFKCPDCMGKCSEYPVRGRTITPRFNRINATHVRLYYPLY